MDRKGVDRARRIVLLAAVLVLLGAGAARAQEFTDAVSRQVSVANGFGEFTDANGRLFSLFSIGTSEGGEAIGRQVALFTGPMGDVDANGRLFSVYSGRAIGSIVAWGRTTTASATFPRRTPTSWRSRGACSTAWASSPTARSWPGGTTTTASATSPRRTPTSWRSRRAATAWASSPTGRSWPGGTTATASATSPRRTPTSWRSRRAGGHSLGLKSDGTIVAWGYERLRPVQRPRAERRLRGGRGGRISQPGPQVRRHDRGLGVQRLRPVQRPRAERRLRGGRGGRLAQPGPQVRRDDRGLGTQLLSASATFPRPTPTSWRSRRAIGISLGLKSDGTIVAWGATATRTECDDPLAQRRLRGGRGRALAQPGPASSFSGGLLFTGRNLLGNVGGGLRGSQHLGGSG